MFESGIEKTIVITAIVLWFAHGWYLNTRLLDVHKKLDKVLDEFNGLRLYLYEIDPQFDDEREALQRFLDEHNADSNFGAAFAAMDDIELNRRKEEQGKRTLSTRFSE
ncbi:MAG: hypothetical protein IPM27_12030 [Nitrosomonadales bacterium]|nr:hypothetical protein [Nitrosomonadales bacterium]